MIRIAQESETRTRTPPDRISQRWIRIIPVALIMYTIAFIDRTNISPFIVLSGVGAYGPMGAFWAIPTETLPARIVGSVTGLANAIGNLGAYFAPLIVGYLNKRTGNFLSGFTYLGAITVVAAVLAMFLRTAPTCPATGTSEGE